VIAVDPLVKGIIIDHEEPEAIYRLVSRKLQKLRSYVERDVEP
jgi:hypothetical protein